MMRLSRTPPMTSPGMIKAERSSQWPKNLGQAPGAPSSTPHTEDDDGVVGQLLEATRQRNTIR
jgi:hypothetical protein